MTFVKKYKIDNIEVVLVYEIWKLKDVGLVLKILKTLL